MCHNVRPKCCYILQMHTKMPIAHEMTIFTRPKEKEKFNKFLRELIFIYCGLFVLILVVFFLCCFFFHYVSAKFHLWPSSGDLSQPRIGMLSLVTVSPVITAFHSCCLSHHVFDQVNLWSAWVGFETAIFWQCSPGTVETQRLYPLRHGPRRKKKQHKKKTTKMRTKSPQ